MKRALVAAIVVAGILTVGGCASSQYASQGRKSQDSRDTVALMTKNDIISLSQAGVSDSLIVAMLDDSGTYFQLSTQDVIDLKNAGVHDAVIKAMMTPPAEETKVSDNSRYYYYYPPYWYAGYPYWDPWYYPSFSVGLGFRYHPTYVHRGFGGHFGGHGFGGRHR